jgi:hypothetical protein
MKNESIERLALIFEHTLGQLGVALDPEKATQLASNIYYAMSSHSRIYHNLDHVFGFVKPDDAVFTLAALYHDIVYYRVDMGFTPEIREIISPYLQELKGEFFIAFNIPDEDELAWMTLDVFNLKPGQQLASVDALNEFLSALVAAREIGGLISCEDLLRIIVSIEATIPFRSLNAQGQSHVEVMEARLFRIADKYCDGSLTLKNIEDTIKTAVVFSNKDISTFSEAEPARFLVNTWKLIPEMSSNLRSPELYTIRNYRLALQGMEGLLSNLNPEYVFHRYKGTPTAEEYQRMTDFARTNISVSSEYLRVYLVATALLEALAQVSGGDELLSVFTGKLPTNESNGRYLRQYLPAMPSPDWASESPTLLELLSDGCAVTAGFDACNSQLSLFVYLFLEPQGMRRAFSLTQDLFAGSITPDGYLRQLDRGLVSAVANAVAQMDASRRERLLEYA